jgi:hypothetical protein
VQLFFDNESDGADISELAAVSFGGSVLSGTNVAELKKIDTEG